MVLILVSREGASKTPLDIPFLSIAENTNVCRWCTSSTSSSESIPSLLQCAHVFFSFVLWSCQMSAMLYVRHSHICRGAKADYLFRSTVPYILTTCQTLTLIYALHNCLHFRFAVLFIHSLFRIFALVALTRREEPWIGLVSIDCKQRDVVRPCHTQESGTGRQEHALLAIGRVSYQL